LNDRGSTPPVALPSGTLPRNGLCPEVELGDGTAAPEFASEVPEFWPWE
jgi:hypothetical protein